MLVITVCYDPWEEWAGSRLGAGLLGAWGNSCPTSWQLCHWNLAQVTKDKGGAARALSSLALDVRLEFAVAFKTNCLWPHSANSLILTTQINENKEKTISPRKLSVQNEQISAPPTPSPTYKMKSSFWYLMTFTVNNCLLWSTKVFIELSLHPIQQVWLIFPFY